MMSDSIPSSWGIRAKEGSDEARALDDILKQLGFEVGEPFGKDAIFRSAKIPEGWEKVAGSHAMHSDIYDNNGFARIGIFYKAAFYDRSANMRFHRRVGMTYDPRLPLEDRNERAKEGRVVYAYGKGDRMSFTILATFHSKVKEGEKFYEVGDRVEKEALAWLTEHYPDHMDPLAYWDQEFAGERYTYT